MGVRPGVQLVGDPDSTLHEKLWLRPTLTVIGIDGHPDQGVVEPDRGAGPGPSVACGSGPGQDPDTRARAACAPTSRRRFPGDSSAL